MKKLLWVLFTIGVISCKHSSSVVPPDLATRASGVYAVQFLQVDGITVWSIGGANKLGLSDFYVTIERLGADSIRVSRSFIKAGNGSGFVNSARVQLRSNQNQYQLVAQKNVADVYESSVIAGSFFERTINMTPNLLLREVGLDTLVGPSKEVVISAIKK